MCMLGFHPKRRLLFFRRSSVAQRTHILLPTSRITMLCLKNILLNFALMAGWPPVIVGRPPVMVDRPSKVACWPLLPSSPCCNRGQTEHAQGVFKGLFAQLTPIFHEQIKRVMNLVHKPSTQAISLHDGIWTKVYKFNGCNKIRL